MKKKKKHAERALFENLVLPKQGESWIGFVQNEWPCIGEGCCQFFSRASNLKGVAGIIFTVQGSGAYAREHDREDGSSGYVYFVKGEMTYTAPNGAPDPPP